MNYHVRKAAYFIWLGALTLGAEAAAIFGARGSWYQGAAIGTAIGLARWFDRPKRDA